jgi:hypothetical protein
VRCLDCAGEPCPTDLPPLENMQIPIVPIPKRGRSGSLPFASLASLAKDFRERQAGDE